MAILDLKSNLSNFRKPTTVLDQEKQKIKEATPVKPVYSTSNELLKLTDIKINKVDNSTSIQVPGAKKIDYKLFSINTKKSKGIPAISTFFGDIIGTKESLFKKFTPGDIVKISEYKEQKTKPVHQASEFVKITPKSIQHISTFQALVTTIKGKISEYVDQLPKALPKISEYIDQLPKALPKISEYIDQTPANLPKISEYINQTPKSLDKISEYIQTLIDNKNSLYYPKAKMDRKARRLPSNNDIHILYANPLPPAVNGFDDNASGAKGFIENQKEQQTAFLGINDGIYTYPQTVRNGRLSDITKIAGALQWPLKVTFSNDLAATKYYRTVYDTNKPYTSSTGITGDDLRAYFTRRNSPSAQDIMYTKFNLRDSSFNTGLALFNQPLILTGIQRKGKGGYASQLNIFDTWKFDDGFIRGGVVTSTQRAIVDTLRIGKWMASVKGLLFLTRQVGLQLSNPNSEQRGTLKQEILVGNGLVSTLANTLAQHVGLRFRKDSIPSIPRNTYSGVMFGTKGFDPTSGRGVKIVKQIANDNRLVKLKEAVVINNATSALGGNGMPLISGPSGPQSVYGIGSTLISRTVKSDIANYQANDIQKYYTYTYKKLQDRSAALDLTTSIIQNFLLNKDGKPDYLVNDFNWISTNGDFDGQGTIIQDYAKTSQHQRKKLQVPDYGVRGKYLNNPLTGFFMNMYKPGTAGMIDPIWKINQPNADAIDDFVKFMFHDLNTNERFRFRAYIENVSEDFSPSWQEVKILGRADSPYIYQGFERGVSISFKVAALSRGDLMLMWDQLERLAKTTVPQYQSDYKMKGPLVKFTLGNWFINTPAFVKSLSYTVDNDTPWEINLGNSSIYGDDATEYNVGELPMTVSVQVSLQIFGEVRPQTAHKQTTPEGVTDGKHYNKGNLYPLGKSGLRALRQGLVKGDPTADTSSTAELLGEITFTPPTQPTEDDLNSVVDPALLMP